MKRLASVLAFGSVLFATSAAFADPPAKLLLDMASYYKVASGTSAPATADFLARFPRGSTIAGRSGTESGALAMFGLALASVLCRRRRAG